MKKDLKDLLWESVSRLMVWRYGKENLSRLAADCKFGLGTSSRIKDRKTEVRLETIDAIAEKFGFEAWQLLVDGFDPADPPRLAHDELPDDQRELLRAYLALDPDTRPALLNRAHSLREAVDSSKLPHKSNAA